MLDWKEMQNWCRDDERSNSRSDGEIFESRIFSYILAVVYEDKSSALQESTIEIRIYKNCSTIINIFLIS